SDATARIYFGLLPHVSRRLGLTNQQRLRNSINSANWAEIGLQPRNVILGNETTVTLYPHFYEFDLEAALARHLTYEHEVFAFLETQMSKYHAVIEIGANVGVFTVFFARWLGKRGKVFAFEPSRTAYERLLQNLAANAAGNAVVFNCAVGKQTGFFPFFEPERHLTNGSFDADFARQFNSTLKNHPALVVDGSLLEQLIAPGPPVLLKIDAEGSESDV